MGNSNSTRKITVPNEDPSNVIKVSDAVVQRMKGADHRKDDDDVRESHTKKVAAVVPLPEEPQPIYSSDPSMTSLQFRYEKEMQLRNNDAYWQQRIANIQDNYKKTNHKMEEEYEAAVQEVCKSFQKSERLPGEYPCHDAKMQVVQCYRDNPKQSLLCSKQVKTFQTCVHKQMISMAENRA